jgi:hypothetical protein
LVDDDDAGDGLLDHLLFDGHVVGAHDVYHLDALAMAFFSALMTVGLLSRFFW